MNFKNPISSEKARYKRLHGICFHSHELSIKGEAPEMSIRFVALWGDEWWQGREDRNRY
jgi:hypothetical protein